MARRRANPEEQLQRSVNDVLALHGHHGWHTPNGGWRTKTEAGRFKAQGVLAGVSDFFIMERWTWAGVDREFDHEVFIQFNRGWMWRPGHHVLEGHNVCLELKIWPNKPTPAQLDFLRMSSERGALCAVAYDMNEALSVLRCVRPANGRRIAT